MFVPWLCMTMLVTKFVLLCLSYDFVWQCLLQNLYCYVFPMTLYDHACQKICTVLFVPWNVMTMLVTQFAPCCLSNYFVSPCLSHNMCTIFAILVEIKYFRIWIYLLRLIRIFECIRIFVMLCYTIVFVILLCITMLWQYLLVSRSVCLQRVSKLEVLFKVDIYCLYLFMQTQTQTCL